MYKIKYGDLLPEEKSYREEAPYQPEFAEVIYDQSPAENTYYVEDTLDNDNHYDLHSEIYQTDTYEDVHGPYDEEDHYEDYSDEYDDADYDAALHDDNEYSHDPLAFFDYVYEQGLTNFAQDSGYDEGSSHGHSHGGDGHRH